MKKNNANNVKPIVDIPKTYQIDFEITHVSSKKKEDITIVIDSLTEENAFELAAKELEKMNTDKNPITWRYLGRFIATPNKSTTPNPCEGSRQEDGG